jgi:hypothetical protein
MVATSRSRTEPIAAYRDAADLRREAVWFARYLIDAEPLEALIERYVRGNAKVLTEPATAADEAVLAFVHKHPWSVGLLDAGTAFLRDAPLLRRKLVVMMAILEATPDHVEATAPVEDAGIARLVWKLGTAGAKAAIKLAVGTALATVVVRR